MITYNIVELEIVKKGYLRFFHDDTLWLPIVRLKSHLVWCFHKNTSKRTPWAPFERLTLRLSLKESTMFVPVFLLRAFACRKGEEENMIIDEKEWETKFSDDSMTMIPSKILLIVMIC